MQLQELPKEESRVNINSKVRIEYMFDLPKAYELNKMREKSLWRAPRRIVLKLDNQIRRRNILIENNLLGKVEENKTNESKNDSIPKGPKIVKPKIDLLRSSTSKRRATLKLALIEATNLTNKLPEIIASIAEEKKRKVSCSSSSSGSNRSFIKEDKKETTKKEQVDKHNLNTKMNKLRIKTRTVGLNIMNSQSKTTERKKTKNLYIHPKNKASVYLRKFQKNKTLAKFVDVKSSLVNTASKNNTSSTERTGLTHCKNYSIKAFAKFDDSECGNGYTGSFSNSIQNVESHNQGIVRLKHLCKTERNANLKMKNVVINCRSPIMKIYRRNPGR